MLLDGRQRIGLRQLLDVGGHDHRLDPVQRQAPGLTPVGEPVRSHQVGHARVRVTDIGGEEFPEPFFGVVGAGKQDRSAPVRNPAHRGVLDGDQLCIQGRLPGQEILVTHRPLYYLNHHLEHFVVPAKFRPLLRFNITDFFLIMQIFMTQK